MKKNIFGKQHAGIIAALEKGFQSRNIESRAWGEVMKILSMKDVVYILGSSMAVGDIGKLMVSKELGIASGMMTFLLSFVAILIKNTIDRDLHTDK